MTPVVRVLLGTAIWLALWSDVSVANVLSGLLASTAVVLVFPSRRGGRPVVRPVRAAIFALFFVYKLVQASLVVARTIVTPHGRVHTGIIAVRLKGRSEAIATVVANAVSLTPGTLTLEVRRDPLTLFVHALDLRDAEQVERDVRTLERLATRAFGPAETVAAVDADQSGRRR